MRFTKRAYTVQEQASHPLLDGAREGQLIYPSALKVTEIESKSD